MPLQLTVRDLACKVTRAVMQRICDRRFVQTMKLWVSFAIRKKGGGGEFMLHKALPLFLDIQQKYET